MLTKAASRLRQWRMCRTGDVLFIGYPKCGNTWTRFLLGSYFQELCPGSPLLLFDGADRWGRCSRACVGPAMHFTHAPLRWDGQTAAHLDESNVLRPYQSNRVVLLMRHPLDALVSNWYHATRRGDADYDGSLSEFLQDPVWGLDKFVRFANLWAQEARRRGDDILLLRYRDLRADTQGWLRRLLEFIEVTPDDPKIEAAVAAASFDRMRELELAGGLRYPSTGLPVFSSADLRDENSRHVRRGAVDGHRDEIEPALLDELLDRIDAELDPWYHFQRPTA